jgi:hypothetical protein
MFGSAIRRLATRLYTQELEEGIAPPSSALQVRCTANVCFSSKRQRKDSNFRLREENIDSSDAG